MRLDPDLIRLLLLKYEGEGSIDLDSYTEEQISYHTYHLVEAGLLKGNTYRDPGRQRYSSIVVDLSWEGHEFVANARNDNFWNRAKAEVLKTGGSVSLDLLGKLLWQIASGHFS